MPKIVDHDQRRIELVGATWRIIARHGIEGVTLRQVAEEAGFANGALKPYFPTKDSLLTFAFAHVFNQTNQRIESSAAKQRGLMGLRTFCHEVLPLDETRISEARIVIPFWQRALTDPAKAALHDRSMDRWREALHTYLQQARDAGELSANLADGDPTDGDPTDGDTTDDDEVGFLMTFLLGAQITAVLEPDEHSPKQLVRQLDSHLRLLS